MPRLQGSGQTSDISLPSFTWDDFCNILDSPSRGLLASKLSVPLPVWLTSPGQYFFEAHPHKLVLEVLCLKLSALNNLCLLVADEHERNRRSRGVIGPEQVVVQFPEHRAMVFPTRWTASVWLKESSQGEPPSFGNMPAEMASSLATIPAGVNLAYAAPLVREWPLGRQMSVTALIQSADPIPDDDQTQMRGLIRVHVIADDLHARDFSDHDVFRVILPLSNSRGASVEVWARKVETPERGVIVSGMSNTLPLDSWNMFSRAVGDVSSAAEITVHRAFSPAHDIYSCGMLLMRALLGSDERRWSRACDLVPSIAEGLEPVVQGIAEDDHYTFHLRVRDRLRESADSFEAEHIPDAIWWDALVAVLRACSCIRGFSYADDATSYEPSPARLLARDVASLARRTRIELFEAGERDAMILRVCDRAMDHLGAGV